MKKIKMDNLVVAPVKKLDLSILKNAESYSVDFEDIDQKVDAVFVKKLRDKLNMSQSFFAQVLGISKKTIEKWEQSANPITGMSSRLIYLIDKYPDLINSFYHETYSKGGFVVKQNQPHQTSYFVQIKHIEIAKPTLKDQSMLFCENCPTGLTA